VTISLALHTHFEKGTWWKENAADHHSAPGSLSSIGVEPGSVRLIPSTVDKRRRPLHHSCYKRTAIVLPDDECYML